MERSRYHNTHSWHARMFYIHVFFNWALVEAASPGVFYKSYGFQLHLLTQRCTPRTSRANIYSEVRKVCFYLVMNEFFVLTQRKIYKIHIYFILGTCGSNHLVVAVYPINFVSPGWPGLYPDNLDCIWVMEAAKGYK